MDELNRPLETWAQLPSGEVLQSMVEQSLVGWWPRIFGLHLIKMGALSQCLDTRLCPIEHQVSIATTTGKTLCADLAHLPFQTQSIDASLISCTLEFDEHPFRVLREVDRCLVPAGHLVLIGFNPVSPLLLGHMLPWKRKQYPWSGQFFLPSRVKEWMALLGYQLVHDERIAYHHLLSPVAVNSGGQRLLESVLPFAGALYIMIARKLNVPLTPAVRQSRRKKKAWIPATQLGRSING